MEPNQLKYYGPKKNPKTPPIGYNPKTELFTYYHNQKIASGYWSNQGFCIKQNSMVWKRNTLKSNYSLLSIRDIMITEGELVLEGDDFYVFMSDCFFSSPSSAARLVHGNDRDGLIDWKDAQGRTLKVLAHI
jgi:hypothetical protein